MQRRKNGAGARVSCWRGPELGSAWSCRGASRPAGIRAPLRRSRRARWPRAFLIFPTSSVSKLSATADASGLMSSSSRLPNSVPPPAGSALRGAEKTTFDTEFGEVHQSLREKDSREKLREKLLKDSLRLGENSDEEVPLRWSWWTSTGFRGRKS